MRIDVIAPAPLGWHSGGSAYDDRLAAALADAGADVRVRVAAGAWPEGSGADRVGLGALLRGIADDGGRAVIVDGLVGLGCPSEVAAAERAGLAVWLLVHMPIADMPIADLPDSDAPIADLPDRAPATGRFASLEAGARAPATGRFASLEAAALAAATGAITPSRFTAADIARRYGVDAAVAIPGVDRAPLAHGSRPPRIVCVAALLPGKRQLALLDILERVTDLPWTAELIGSERADPDYARAVRRAAGSPSLRGRVDVAGELLGDELEAAWAAADLSILASETETFGLVVTESLAHGVPAIVAAGTGAEEALALSLRGDAGLAGAAGLFGDDAGPAGAGSAEGSSGAGSTDGRPEAGSTDGRSEAGSAEKHSGAGLFGSDAKRAGAGSSEAGSAEGPSGAGSADGRPEAGSAERLFGAGSAERHSGAAEGRSGANSAEAVLRAWLTDPGLRAAWSTAARAARPSLPGWDATARAVLEALAPVQPAQHPGQPPQHPDQFPQYPGQPPQYPGQRPQTSADDGATHREF